MNINSKCDIFYIDIKERYIKQKSKHETQVYLILQYIEHDI